MTTDSNKAVIIRLPNARKSETVADLVCLPFSRVDIRREGVCTEK